MFCFVLFNLPVVGAICVPLELTETSSPRRNQLIPSRLVQSIKVVLKNQFFRQWFCCRRCTGCGYRFSCSGRFGSRSCCFSRCLWRRRSGSTLHLKFKKLAIKKFELLRIVNNNDLNKKPYRRNGEKRDGRDEKTYT